MWKGVLYKLLKDIGEKIDKPLKSFESKYDDWIQLFLLIFLLIVIIMALIKLGRRLFFKATKSK